MATWTNLEEEIVLHATVLKEDLDKAADLLFELTTSATFPENEIETEKGVVLDEIQSYKDSPSEDIYDKFEEMFFEGHPLSGLILGTTASVKKISREELLRFTKEKFIPSNMAFSIVADLDEKVMEKKVKKLISKYFPTLEEPQKKEIPEFTYEPKIFDKTLNKRNHQVNCIIGGLAPSLYKTKERVATVLLVNILGGPANNSLLNATLREKYGWVYGVECSYNQYSDCGLVTISLGCDKDNLDKCLHHTKKIIAKLQECELSDKKLREAKKQLLGQLAISSDNGETQCLSLGKSLLAFGIVNSDSDTKKIIEEITSKDLQEMAQTIFDPSKTSKLIYI